MTKKPLLSSPIGFFGVARGSNDETPTIEQISPNARERPAGRRSRRRRWSRSSAGGLEERHAQDHRADVLGGGGLEEVGAAARAVADVVADEVRDDGRVARIVLGDAGLDLADEVRADIGGLGVDAAAELGEEGDEARAEGEADDPERRFRDAGVRTFGEEVDEPVDAADAEQRRARPPGSRRPRRRGARSIRASPRPVRAAAAVRMLLRTATYMPMNPEMPERAAPIRKAIAVMTPRSTWWSFSKIATRMPITTATTMARWRWCGIAGSR